jgi:predicted trehalose synthase
VLDKALYELNYELNKPPEWVQVHLRGIFDLVNEGL